SRPASTRQWPRCASWSAKIAPSPELAPVMTANDMAYSLLCNGFHGRPDGQGVADESDRGTEDGPDRPEVGGVGRQGDCRPDSEHDRDHREVGGEVNAHAEASRGGAGGAAARVGALDAVERQVGDELLEPPCGLRLERLLDALFVFVEVQVALRERLAEAV